MCYSRRGLLQITFSLKIQSMNLKIVVCCNSVIAGLVRSMGASLLVTVSSRVLH
jgi:hypothetical protein